MLFENQNFLDLEKRSYLGVLNGDYYGLLSRVSAYHILNKIQYYAFLKEISPWKKHKKTLLFEYGRVLKLGFLPLTEKKAKLRDISLLQVSTQMIYWH